LKEQLDSKSTAADGLGADDGDVIADEVPVFDGAGLAVFDEDVHAAVAATRHNAPTRRSADHPRVVMRHCVVDRCLAAQSQSFRCVRRGLQADSSTPVRAWSVLLASIDLSRPLRWDNPFVLAALAGH